MPPVSLLLRLARRLLRFGLAAVNRGLRNSHTAMPVLTSEEEHSAIRGFLLSLDQPDTNATGYLREHLERLAFTIQILPPASKSKRCLELGSYMHLAPTVRQFRGFTEIRTADFGPKGTKVQKVAYSAGRELLRTDTDLFDAERDTFPYGDGYFEAVLACEILEHLRVDPMHMVFEIHRVLEHQGVLLITTPNCASLASLEQILWRSSNPYTYSLYPHPRASAETEAPHIREYTPDELRAVLDAAGFHVDVLMTQPGRAVETEDLVQDILLRYGFPTDLRGQQIYCIARKTAEASDRYPSFLYG